MDAENSLTGRWQEPNRAVEWLRGFQASDCYN